MARLIRTKPRARSYHNIFSLWEEFHSNEDKFMDLFGLNKTQFETLYVMLQPAINVNPIRHMNREIRPRDETALFLRFLSSGKPYSVLAKNYKIPVSIISKVVEKVNDLVVQTLQPIVMPPPSVQLWQELAEDFMRIHQMPHCIGFVYGRFLNIVDEKIHILLLIISAKQKFVIVDVGDYDTTQERIWFNSILGQQFENSDFELPIKHNLGSYKKQLPYVLIGGNSFPLRPYLIRKFRDDDNDARKVFDSRINVVKANAEEAVTRLRRRWKIIQSPISVPVENIENLIVSAACLENYFSPLPVRQHLSTIRELPPTKVAELRQTVPKNSTDVRDKFLDYFLSPQGCVPWQYEQLSILF